jgi:exonuclease SbcD
MLRILHVSDIHLGSGFNHGRVNPETGMNTRLEDFLQSLERCIDRAIAEPVDAVLFGGDAFPDATPPPYVQAAFAQQFRRLADADIPTVLLVGNHDQHAHGHGGDSLSIYRTLAVPGFLVGDRIMTHHLQTPNGDLQVVTLPWLTRSTLLTRSKTQGLSMAEVNDLLIETLLPILEAEIRRLDPKIPTVLLAHLMADRANLGAERFLAVGKGFTVPVSLLIRPEFDYVALGHVHRHQNLNPDNNPPVVYPGSIERVDFSEEKEAKGYVYLKLAKGQADWEFCPLPTRSFLTIKVDLSDAENPQTVLLDAIAQHDITEAVVRLIYALRSEQLDSLDNGAIQQALASAHSYTINPELVSQLARPRVPELGVAHGLDPLEVLQTYLDNHPDLQDLADAMQEAAAKLLAGEEIDTNLVPTADIPQTQLSLL